MHIQEAKGPALQSQGWITPIHAWPAPGVSLGRVSCVLGANLLTVNYLLTHRVPATPTEDLHQTDDATGIPQYILVSMPSIFLFSRWKCGIWMDDRGSAYSRLRDSGGSPPRGQGSRTAGLQQTDKFFLGSKVLLSDFFLFFNLTWFYLLCWNEARYVASYLITSAF